MSWQPRENGKMGATKYRNASAVLVTPRGVARKVVAPMRNQCIPTTSEDTTESVRIPLHSTRGDNLYAVVDAVDVALVSAYRWHPLYKSNGAYAYAKATVNGKRQTILMHRLILGIDDPGIWGDHWDHNTLNNRRKNLRAVTPYENTMNRQLSHNGKSKHVGVSWDGHAQKWRARIRTGSIDQSLGLFASESDAANAYDKAARNYSGSEAIVSFLAEDDVS